MKPPLPSSIAKRMFARVLSPLWFGIDQTTYTLLSGPKASLGPPSSPSIASTALLIRLDGDQVLPPLADEASRATRIGEGAIFMRDSC